MSDNDFYTRPILSVRDIRSSIAYYCDKLGFEKSWDFGDEILVIAQVGRNGLDIILDAESAIPRAAVPSVLRACPSVISGRCTKNCRTAER